MINYINKNKLNYKQPPNNPKMIGNNNLYKIFKNNNCHYKPFNYHKKIQNKKRNKNPPLSKLHNNRKRNNSYHYN